MWKEDSYSRLLLLSLGRELRTGFYGKGSFQYIIQLTDLYFLRLIARDIAYDIPRFHNR